MWLTTYLFQLQRDISLKRIIDLKVFEEWLDKLPKTQKWIQYATNCGHKTELRSYTCLGFLTWGNFFMVPYIWFCRLSIIIIILESRHLHTVEEDIHDWHPDLKSKLTPGDKCWQNETVDILQNCDLCTGKITFLRLLKRDSKQVSSAWPWDS